MSFLSCVEFRFCHHPIAWVEILLTSLPFLISFPPGINWIPRIPRSQWRERWTGKCAFWGVQVISQRFIPFSRVHPPLCHHHIWAGFKRGASIKEGSQKFAGISENVCIYKQEEPKDQNCMKTKILIWCQPN